VLCDLAGNPAFSSSYKQLADAISGSIFTVGANGLFCLVLLVTHMFVRLDWTRHRYLHKEHCVCVVAFTLC